MAEGAVGSYELTTLTGFGNDAPIPAMDPRLQRLVALRQHGIQGTATSSTTADEVAVVAKVTDVDAWEALSEVHPGRRIGDTAEDGTTVVTARLPIDRLEFVRAQPFVVSLKGGQRLTPALSATTEEMAARPKDLPAGNGSKGGKGVVVGIVDFGCDFAHKNFRTSAGKTRLLKLWDQAGGGVGQAGFDYGSVFAPKEINKALSAADPYVALGYGPDPAKPAHGTHVMDIAAGNGLGSTVPGVAPSADVVFVQLAASDVPWGGSEAVGKSFGDSIQLLEALSFIFDTAGTKPCVVNVSLGTNGGPHDGSTLVEQGIDRLLDQAPNRAVVIAASNSFTHGIHVAGTVPKTGALELGWKVFATDNTDNEFELWCPGSARLSLEIVAPSGQAVGTIPPGRSATVTSAGQVVLFASNRLNDPGNGDNMIGVFMSPAAPTGIWKLRLKGAGAEATPFHAWIERDDLGQSTFVEPLDGMHTIGSISCGRKTVVVGSYDAHKPGKPISHFSSAGPTRDGREKPEISAPGHDVLAAASRTGTGTARKSGTSMAAPAVTGAIALLLATARAHNRTLSADEIRAAVIKSARLSPPASAWDSRFGNGRLSAASLLEHGI